MFYGEYHHAIDKKGRLIIPAKFRGIFKKLGNSNFMITRGLEKSLFIFSLEEWQIQESKFKSLPLEKSNPRAISRILFSGAHRCSLDRQGRVNLPQSLIQYADLKKEAVIVGVSNRIEIWDRSRWNNYLKRRQNSFIAIAEEFIKRKEAGKVETKPIKSFPPAGIEKGSN